MKAPKSSTGQDTDDDEARQMIWFLFIGDMLVMFFMCALVVWFFMKSSADVANAAARIPLEDEYKDD